MDMKLRACAGIKDTSIRPSCTAVAVLLSLQCTAACYRRVISGEVNAKGIERSV